MSLKVQLVLLVQPELLLARQQSGSEYLREAKRALLQSLQQ
jgi:hypothetical protein